MNIEAMKQALEALEEPKEHVAKHRRLEAIIALRQAIEEAEKRTHSNHPMRHFDRTCPACVGDDSEWQSIIRRTTNASSATKT